MEGGCGVLIASRKKKTIQVIKFKLIFKHLFKKQNILHQLRYGCLELISYEI